MVTKLLLVLIFFSSFSGNTHTETNKDDYERENIYYRIIEKADKLVSVHSYKKARELFGRATILRPSDPYPKVQLFIIDKLISGE